MELLNIWLSDVMCLNGRKSLIIIQKSISRKILSYILFINIALHLIAEIETEREKEWYLYFIIFLNFSYFYFSKTFVDSSIL